MDSLTFIGTATTLIRLATHAGLGPMLRTVRRGATVSLEPSAAAAERATRGPS